MAAKQEILSPRCSETGKNHSSSYSEKSRESSSSSDGKRKVDGKEESGKQNSKGPAAVLKKKKRLDARSFRAYLQLRGSAPALREQSPSRRLLQSAQWPLQASSRPVQVVHHPSALFSGNQTAPHVMPPVPPRVNLQVKTGVWSPGPHLRSLKSSSILPPSQPPLAIGTSNRPTPFTPPLPHQPPPFDPSCLLGMTPPLSQSLNNVGASASPVSVLGLLMDVSNHHQVSLPDQLLPPSLVGQPFDSVPLGLT